MNCKIETAKSVTPPWLMVGNQMINNLLFLKTVRRHAYGTKKGNKMQEKEEIVHRLSNYKYGVHEPFGVLRQAQNDKKREGWQRLPHSAARSNSVQPDPQGHAQNWNRLFTISLLFLK